MDLESCTIHITDPRKSKNLQYSLQSLMLIVFSSVISGYDTPSGMAEFAKIKLDWLRKFVDLKQAPCKETLRFFLCSIQPHQLIKGFEAFVRSSPDGDIISIDGKTMRGTRTENHHPLHVISAWSQSQGITLAALESKGKSNEIKTIPELVDCIDVKNATVTTDAMGCQKDIAQKIREGEGDYVLQIKNNQASLLEEIKAWHHKKTREGFSGILHEQYEEVDKGHGRMEQRVYEHFELDDWIEGRSQWAGLQSAIRVQRTRTTSSGESSEVSWYISSLAVEARHAAAAVRGHWEVENKLHWRLDVIFREDDCRLQSGGLSMAVIKRFCMNLLSVKDDSKRTMKNRVMAAAIDDAYREQVLLSG